MTNMERMNRIAEIIGDENALDALMGALGEYELGEYVEFIETSYDLKEEA